MNLSERLRNKLWILKRGLWIEEPVIEEIAALESALAAKDAEIAQLREDAEHSEQIIREMHKETLWIVQEKVQILSNSAFRDWLRNEIAALAETPAAPDAAIIGPDGKGSATGANPLAAPEVK